MWVYYIARCEYYVTVEYAKPSVPGARLFNKNVFYIKMQPAALTRAGKNAVDLVSLK